MGIEEDTASMEECIQLALKEGLQNQEDRMAHRAKQNVQPTSGYSKATSLEHSVMLPADTFIHPDCSIGVMLHFWETIYDPHPEQSPFRENDLHCHDFYELNYVYRGQVKNVMHDCAITQHAEQLLVMNPYARHVPRIQKKDTILFNILIRRDFFVLAPGGTGTSLLDLFSSADLGMNTYQSYILLDCTEEIKRILHQIIREYFHRPVNYQEMLYAKVIELWIELKRAHHDYPLKKDSTGIHSEKMNEILDYICNHYNTVTEREAAEHFGMNRSNFSAYVRQYCGQTFSDILRHFKLQHAISYLIYSDLDIESVADKIGYNDASYFRKVFKKEYGISPNQYRLRFQKNLKAQTDKPIGQEPADNLFPDS